MKALTVRVPVVRGAQELILDGEEEVRCRKFRELEAFQEKRLAGSENFCVRLSTVVQRQHQLLFSSPLKRTSLEGHVRIQLVFQVIKDRDADLLQRWAHLFKQAIPYNEHFKTKESAQF